MFIVTGAETGRTPLGVQCDGQSQTNFTPDGVSTERALVTINMQPLRG